MTERGRAALDRSATHLAIGPSRIEWDGTTLTVSVEEVTCPWPSRLRGTIRLRPDGLARHTVELDAEGRHRWRPLAPSAHVELDFTEPGLRWKGHDIRLCSDGFEAGRQLAPSRAVPRRGGGTSLVATPSCWRLTRHGAKMMFAPLRQRGVAHEPIRRRASPCRTQAGESHERRAPTPEWHRRPGPQRTLENTRFTHAAAADSWKGETVQAMHESLSLNRFRTAWVRTLLPFRMPRRARWDRPRD
jgi:carotenoid 1,2-hydratase